MAKKRNVEGLRLRRPIEYISTPHRHACRAMPCQRKSFLRPPRKLVGLLLVIVGILRLSIRAKPSIPPIGLSVTAELTPDAFRTQTLALLSVSISLGTTVFGLLAVTAQLEGVR